ncbi:MAG TPA: hypothetical protein VGF70_16055 [Solirubrobacteraceae bacterium]
MTLLVAIAAPAAAQAGPQYRFCTPVSSGTTYLLALGHMACSQARSLERAALRQTIVRHGPSPAAGWWSAAGGRWQTAARGKPTAGPYRGTWSYGIWSARGGVDTCPTVYFFLRRKVRTVAS